MGITIHVMGHYIDWGSIGSSGSHVDGHDGKSHVDAQTQILGSLLVTVDPT